MGAILTGLNTDLKTGLAALEAGDDAQASKALACVAADDPGYARAQNLLAQIDLRAGVLETALDHARRALSAAPAEFGCHITLGRVYEALEDFRAAREASRAAIEIDENSFDAWFLYGTQALKLGDYAAAADAYRRAHQISPDRLEALVNLGSALDRHGKPADALAAYQKALHLQPEEPRILANIGRLHSDAGDFPAAIEAYERALTAHPEFTDGWINLAVASLKANDPQRAIDAVHKCLTVSPADRAATSLALMAYQQLGDMQNYRALYAFDELIYSAGLDVPAEFDSIEAFNASLTSAVLSHPTLIHEPAGKSTRLGQQSGNLLQSDETGIFAILHQAVLGHMQKFLARSFDRAGHPYAQFAPADCDFYMWATVLDEQGHQEPHIHPAGWISGVYYVQIPAADTENVTQKGWIEFGRPDPNIPGIDASNTDLATFPPEEGRLFLFPSYFYHRTIPYSGSKPRISIAFDLIPKRLRKTAAAVRTGARAELESQLTELMRRGRLDEAQQVCAAALTADAGDPVALAMMGHLLQQRGAVDQAAKFFQRSVEADPGSLSARLPLIGLARQRRQHRLALSLANDGLDHAAAGQLYVARAELNIDLGRFDAARLDLRAALADMPSHGRAAWLAALLDDEQLDTADLTRAVSQCPPGQRAGLHFALGRLYERRKEPKPALDNYQKANQIMHQRLAPSIRPVDVDALKRTFTRELYENFDTDASSTDTPVLIVGMPRTGTTLVEQLLASHPDVRSAGETDLLWRVVGDLAGRLPPGSQMPADINRLPKQAAQLAGTAYVAALERQAGAAARIVDRHLQNHSMLGILQLMLPNARVIRCCRGDADTRWSCYANWFDYALPYAYDLKSIAEAQQQESALHDHWTSVLSLRMLTVDYE
ncbi:MAG: TIGR02466 family protein, partial [Gammaproteobacteria bacterium]|nr:TIGR02466 family protein [Gammaproteobacteria bacterium]